MRGRLLPPLLSLLCLLILLLPAASLAAGEAPADSAAPRPDGAEHICAITFDDGPGKHTDALLDILKARGIPATFFVLGSHVATHPEAIRRMAAEGHEVDNHSYDHPDFRKLTPEAQKAEIEKTETALRALGVTPGFFRPPYGEYNEMTVRLAAQDGMTLALWSVDSLDWKYRTVQGMEAHVLPRKGGPGGIYLFHDIHATTVAAMPEVLDRLAERGCRFVTVSRWLALRHPALAANAGGVAAP